MSAPVDSFLERHPNAARNIARYGWLALLVLAALLLAGGTVLAGGRSQQIVYATSDGSIVSLEPVSGSSTILYKGGAGHYATMPGRTGSRSISFTVLRDDGGSVRGNLYGADIVRETRALLQDARPGEVFAYPDYAADREWVMANRFTRDTPPNVEVFTASAAASRLLEPDTPGASALAGPSWTAERSIYAWRVGQEKTSLTAYNFFERRQAAVYETKDVVGPASYYFDGNAFLFAERPRGAGLEDSRIKVLVGTGTAKISGVGELGLYDPSSPATVLGGKISVIWTDGEKTGIGMIDPRGWTFSKTGIEVAAGSRDPRLSNDGLYVATTDSAGKEITVRRLDDGGVVRRIRDAQPPETAIDRMREAGIKVPEETGWLAPPDYGWRSLEDT
ncbi:MAG TPA: hypothetical protein VFJ72_09665 [Rubrobacteraceae bacterium]|nr:hypothetical protein [Rubrobacteraceae bacterium]